MAPFQYLNCVSLCTSVDYFSAFQVEVRCVTALVDVPHGTMT